MPRAIDVLYWDAAIIVIDKPPGLASVPVKGLRTPFALEMLRTELPPPGRIFVVHRIDRFTSGAILFAATPQAREVLIKQFLEHAPDRQYLAVVRGHLSVTEGTLVHYLRRDGMYQKVSADGDPRGTRAELRHCVERVLNGASLIRVELVTGLQNQIRAQFAAAGHVVIADRKYAPKEAAERLIDRVALHAAHLAFTHPQTGKVIAIDCEPPADFRRLVQALREGADLPRRSALQTPSLSDGMLYRSGRLGEIRRSRTQRRLPILRRINDRNRCYDEADLGSWLRTRDAPASGDLAMWISPDL